MIWLIILSASALVILLLTMAMNLFIFPKLRRTSEMTSQQLASILIPARNEAQVITQALTHLCAQTYEHYEIIVLDDQSTDGTDQLVAALAQTHERLRLIRGQALPAGWVGKNWACQQLAQAATGDVLIFTDADVCWQAGSLQALMIELEQSPADLITIWSTQVTETWAERWTVPLMAMVILGYLPTIMVHHSPLSLFAAANGQCMAWRRAAYTHIGGHAAVAHTILEDVTLARRAKQAGYSIRMFDAAGLIQTRMYHNWQSVRAGFAKNILVGYGGVWGLLLGTLFHWLVFLLPYTLLFWQEWRLWGLLLIIAGWTLRAVSAIFTSQRVIDTLALPISVILFTIIATQAVYWHITGTTQWKGRQIT